MWIIPGLAQNTGKITDAWDGNTYNTVKIGDQWWMAENLKSTHYKNGVAIQTETNNILWSQLTIGGYCSYNNDDSNVPIYGRLYNHYAVVSSNGLCPDGWHIPSKSEWLTLINYLGGESIAGAKMKEVGTSHWESPNFGATNESGFTALPAGHRASTGTFGSLGSSANFWTSEPPSNNLVDYHYILYRLSSILYSDGSSQDIGHSVRCVMDAEIEHDTIHIPRDFATIQAGIDAASTGDIVLVHPETYLENINFNGKNITVASLFFTTQDASYISQTIIDGSQSGSVVTINSGESAIAELDGFKIINGKAESGGGVFIYNANPTIKNCILSDNQSEGKGHFTQGGGGIFISSSSSIIEQTTLINNQANQNGGGIAIIENSNVQINNCMIQNNTAGDHSGGVSSFYSKLEINTTKLYGNKSDYGGSGFYSYRSQISICNCLFYENNHDVNPGDKSSVFFDYCNITCVNSTFTNNDDGILLNGEIVHGSSFSFKNCILWNSEEEFTIYGDATIQVTYSIIRGGFSGTGNIDSNPLFIDINNNDYHLSDYSPCIGTGTGVGAPTIDLDRNSRPNPTGSNPDIGAYENNLAAKLTIPTVTTADISNITETTVDGGGNVTDDGGSAVTARGVCWNTSSSPTISDKLTSDGAGIGAFVSNITGLMQNTTYFVRAYATNSAGTAYGNEESFITIDVIDYGTIITHEVTNITNNSAVMGGKVISCGGDQGFCIPQIFYSTNPNFDNPIGSIVNPDNDGNFYFQANASNIHCLLPRTKYYVRSEIINSAGTSYGNVVTFNTLDANTKEDGIFIDTRDNINYKYKQFGSQIWMIENLRFIPFVSKLKEQGGIWVNGFDDNNVAVAKNEENYIKYGCLYDLQMALVACPIGWHLPSDDEWKTLEVLLGMTPSEADDQGSRYTGSVGRKMKSVYDWALCGNGDNFSGFNTFSGGHRHYSDGGEFYTQTWQAYFWTATTYNISSWSRMITYNSDGINRHSSNTSFGFSVRCIKDDGGTPVEINRPMSQGWTWFSLNVICSDMSLHNVLSSLPISELDYIKSQTASATYYNGDGWVGNLTHISNTDMYKIKLAQHGNLVYEGLPVPTTLPILVTVGWNWIAYAPGFNSTISDALSTLSIQPDDYIKNQTLSSKFYDIHGWFGTLTELQPLDGYMLRLSTPGILVYPTDPVQIPLKFSNGNITIPDYKLEPAKYEFNGSVTAEVIINGENIGSDDNYLYAFSGIECRGVAKGLIFPGTNKFIYNLMMYSNVESCEELNFRFYIEETDHWYEFSETLTFEPDMIEANAYDPFELKNGSAMDTDWMINNEFSFEVYPNPFNGMLKINFINPKNQIVSIAIYDGYGRKIEVIDDKPYQSGTYNIEWNAEGLPNGVYYIRVQTDGFVRNQKVVKVK